MIAPSKAMKNTVVLITAILAFSFVYAADSDCTFNFFANVNAGNISTPNYPSSYPNSKDCSWSIETIPGNTISLTFYDFGMESDSDFLVVYDGNTMQDRRLGRFSGSRTPSPIASTSNKMLVVFHSDGSVVGRGFIASYTKVFSSSQLKEVLLNTRQQQVRSVNKWGSHIARTAVSLYLADQHIFDTDNKIGEEISLEVSLQLLSKLALKKKISTKDLSLYINALTVTCFDPKDFYGANLVEELRKRVDKGNDIHPFSIFTLCNAGDSMTMDDVSNLQMQFDAHIRPVWTDVQAMVVIALSCIRSRSELSVNESVMNGMVSELKRKQHNNGTIDDWKTTALVVQALMAADDYHTDFDLSAAVKVIEYGMENHTSIQDIYYALPALNGMSLVNISSAHCGGTFMQTETKEIEIPVERIQVQFSVITNDDMDFSRSWKLRVPPNSTFYQALEILGTVEPTYKAQYRVSEGKPYVTCLGNLMDDVESGTYWFIYTKLSSSPMTLKLIELSPVDIQLTETHEMVLWYKSGFITDSEEGSDEFTPEIKTDHTDSEIYYV